MHFELEILLFSLVSFLPCLLLELFAFRHSLRFSPAVTAVLTGVLCLFQTAFGLWLAPGASRISLALAETLLSGLFFLFIAKDQTGKKLFMLLMIANDANLSLTATEFLMGRFFSGSALHPYHWACSMVLLAVECVVLAPMFFYTRKVYAGNRQMNAWGYLWLIPLTFYLIWLFLFCFGMGAILSETSSGQFFLVTLMLCLGTIFVYILVSRLIREHQQNQALREKEYMLTMQQNQYMYLQDRIEEARRAKHDLRHHLHLISVYLNDGKMEELRAYLEKYSASIPDDSRISYCDHYAANALLMYFVSQAKNAGIRWEVSVDLPLTVGIPDNILTVVLGNLLENAIAACKKETGSPMIRVYGRTDDSAVFFKITNTCTQRLKKSPSGQYHSTTAGGQGIGLSSVKHIADQYDGIMETNQKDGVFTVSVMLTMPDNPTE